MSASASKTPKSKPQIPDSKNPEESDPDHLKQEPIKPNGENKDQGEEEQEEEGECGFCLFMKGGGCREAFISWEDCIQESEKKGEDIVEKCFEVTAALKKCMEAHADYYEPILRAEKTVEEEAAKELEKEKAADESASIVVEINTDK
uniref:Uncharacterized protein MANES_08G154000 n=1 Tax=Rhizophora mucronata TaxID=61149 RepID=A0A2P2L423_RHIMU